jgi:hypothetical protein
VEALTTLQSAVVSESVLRSSERHFYLWMAGVFVLTTGFDRRSADRRRHDLRLANKGTAASGIRLRRSDYPCRPVADRTRFNDSNLDEHRQVPGGTRGLKR